MLYILQIPEILLLRRGRKDEIADGPNEFEIGWPHATALTDRDETLHRFVSFFHCFFLFNFNIIWDTFSFFLDVAPYLTLLLLSISLQI